MGVKVNLKKYLAVGGKWQFVPVLKTGAGDTPEPSVVLIKGEPVRNTTGTFYIEWREHGKRVQQPVGTTPREAKDAWANKVKELDPETTTEDAAPLPIEHVAIKDACDNYLKGVRATKAESTYDAYRADLAWFQKHITGFRAAHVTRKHILDLLGKGREEDANGKALSQATINRRVLVGLMALRDAGATVQLKKRDWPKVDETEITTYTPKEITAFLKACNDDERLIFETYLVTGFRNREVATLTWDSIDWQQRTLGVKARTRYKFKPKSYETRTVSVPAAFLSKLKKHQARQKKQGIDGALVFPTTPHPKRPNYGGGEPDAHHLELCKEIALKAKLNCRQCSVVRTITKTNKKTKMKTTETWTESCSRCPCCEKWFLHKWRHTAATNLLQSGIDIRSLQVLMGHKHLSTTEKYLKAMRVADLGKKIEASSLARFIAA
jgi:site-specific recombinase XerD